MVNKLTIGPTLPIIEMNLKKKIDCYLKPRKYISALKSKYFSISLQKSVLLKEINIVWK